MRRRTLILMATVLTLLGLVVPASAAVAAPADGGTPPGGVHAAEARVSGQLPDGLKPVFHQFVSEAGQLADVVASGVIPDVTAATPETWNPEHLPIVQSLQALFAFFKANWKALAPDVIYLLKSLIPGLPLLIPFVPLLASGLKPLVMFIYTKLPTLAPLFVGVLCAVGTHLLPKFATLVGQVCDFVKGIVPTVLGFLPALFKSLPGVVLPLVNVGCDLAAKFLPSQAALIKTACDLIKGFLGSATTTSTAAPTTTSTMHVASAAAASSPNGGVSASAAPSGNSVVIAASPAVAAGSPGTGSSVPYGLVGLVLSALASIVWVLRRRTVYAN